jgi:TPR repeat protein
MRSFLTAMLVLSAISSGVCAAEPQVHTCDHLAAAPSDPRKLVPGVPFSGLEPIPAIAACQSAVAEFPGVARFELHLGRALDRALRFDAARTWYERAAAKCEAIAMFNVGSIYFYSQGDGLAQQSPDDGQAAGIRWYERSAALGQSEAIYALRQLRGETTVKRADEDSHCFAAS